MGLGAVLALCVWSYVCSRCLYVFGHGRIWWGWARSWLSVSGLMCVHDVSMCLGMGAFGGGWARSWLSVSGVMLASWMERLIRFTILADFFVSHLFGHTSFERKGGLKYASLSSDTTWEKKQYDFVCCLMSWICLHCLGSVLAPFFLHSPHFFAQSIQRPLTPAAFVSISAWVTSVRCPGNSPRHPCTGCRNIIVPKYMMCPFYWTHILLESSEQLQLLDVALSRRVRNARQTQAAHHF